MFLLQNKWNTRSVDNNRNIMIFVSSCNDLGPVAPTLLKSPIS